MSGAVLEAGISTCYYQGRVAVVGKGSPVCKVCSNLIHVECPAPDLMGLCGISIRRETAVHSEVGDCHPRHSTLSEGEFLELESQPDDSRVVHEDAVSDREAGNFSQSLLPSW